MTAPTVSTAQQQLLTSQIQMRVASKALDQARAEGETAIKLIESASPPATSQASDGRIDVYA